MSQPTDPQLQLLAEDVGYELWMAAAVARMGATGALASEPLALVAVNNALLETTMLHVRNVDTFLRSTDSAEDDVIALHYVSTWPCTPVLTKDEAADLNKRLMHLSQQRVRLNATWDRPGFVRRTLDTFKTFHDALRDAHPERAAWFDPLVARAESSLAGAVSIVPQL